MNRLNNLLYATAVVSFLALTTPALAHAPIMGIGGVFGGTPGSPARPETPIIRSFSAKNGASVG